ncbi:hypothetical protein ES703_20798 [subsurface metagenome]
MKVILCGPIPLIELPDFPTYYNEKEEAIKYSESYTSLNYNVDEEWCEIELEADEVVHDWLLKLMPELKGIANSKGWRLDKTKLDEVRRARSLANSNP